MGKKGKPPKRSEEEEVESSLLISTTNDGQGLSNPFSPPPGFRSAPMHHPPAPRRYPTRERKTVFGQRAKLTTQSRYPLRSVKGITGHSSTLTPRRRVLDETSESSGPTTGNVPTSNYFTFKRPFQTQVSNTPATSSSERVKVEDQCQFTRQPWLPKRGKIIANVSNFGPAESENLSDPAANYMLDIENLTSNLLRQSQGPENLHPDDAAPTAPHEVVFDNHPPIGVTVEASTIIGNRQEKFANNLGQKLEPTNSLSLNLTEMAAMLNNDNSDAHEVGSALQSALVTVNGYRVKEEFASLLRDIFSKYGDIAKNSSLQSVSSRSSFLELVCGIYQRLDGTTFTDITPIELRSMLDIIGDIQFVKLEVGWLQKRLDEIYEAKLLLRGCSSLKEAKTKNSEAIAKVEKEVEGYKVELLGLQEKIYLAEDKLAEMKAETEKINRRASEAKTKVKCFYRRSLLDGLLQ